MGGGSSIVGIKVMMPEDSRMLRVCLETYQCKKMAQCIRTFATEQQFEGKRVFNSFLKTVELHFEHCYYIVHYIIIKIMNVSACVGVET